MPEACKEGVRINLGSNTWLEKVSIGKRRGKTSRPWDARDFGRRGQKKGAKRTVITSNLVGRPSCREGGEPAQKTRLCRVNEEEGRMPEHGRKGKIALPQTNKEEERILFPVAMGAPRATGGKELPTKKTSSMAKRARQCPAYQKLSARSGKKYKMPRRNQQSREKKSSPPKG